MLKRIALVVLTFVFLVGVASAQTTNTATVAPARVVNTTPRAVPVGMDIVKYPIMPANHRLTVAEIAKYELRPVRLDKDVVVYNYSTSDRAFWLDTLKTGELVLADANGEPVYKEDCGNRVAIIKPCPACMPTMPTPVTLPATAGNVGDNTDGGGGYAMPGWLRSLWHGLGNLLLFLLACALIALLLALAYLFARWLADMIRNSGGSSGGQRFPPPPVTRMNQQVAEQPRQGQPAVARPDQDAPPLGVGPAGDGLVWRQHGPFQMVSVTNAGRRGQRVIGYHRDGRNEDFGVVADVYTEDRGADGHTVWLLTR